MNLTISADANDFQVGTGTAPKLNLNELTSKWKKSEDAYEGFAGFFFALRGIIHMRVFLNQKKLSIVLKL